MQRPAWRGAFGLMWRIKHNWHCRGPENRSRESVWEFESLILRQIARAVRSSSYSLIDGPTEMLKDGFPCRAFDA